MMIKTEIQLTDMSTAWGLVEVFGDDHVLVRSYRIDADSADAVAKGATPPGCTQEEWSSGLVRVTTRPCLQGQAVMNPDGALIVNYGISEVGNNVVVKLMRVPASAWRVDDGEVWMNADIAKQVRITS